MFHAALNDMYRGQLIVVKLTALLFCTVHALGEWVIFRNQVSSSYERPNPARRCITTETH